jgi:hypothetical protein
VICIDSSDFHGNLSGFNSTASGDRICTLGEAVPSPELDSQGRTVYRSGTSFAAPIAVAIAATVLEMMKQADPKTVPGDFEDMKRRSRTKLGMESVLRSRCVLGEHLHNRAGYSYITPWFFLNTEEVSRMHFIANDLRKIPE